MSTIGEAIAALNKQTHKYNFHVTMVSMDLLPDGTNEEKNTSHDLMQQTYDWSYAGKINGHDLPDKDTVYHVDLTADNIAYIGRALDVYDKLLFEVHTKPILENMAKKMGDVNADIEK